MKLGKTLGILTAATFSAGAHLLLLNAFAKPQPPVLIKGGSLQVEIGLNSSSSLASAAGAQRAVPEDEETSALKSAGPEEPEPAPKSRQEPRPATEDEIAPLDKKPLAPVDNLLESAPEEKPEHQPTPASQATPPLPAASEDQSQNTTEQAPAPEGGTPSAPSVGSSSSDAGPAQPASKAGNAESENYAGQVMEHLSRVRRPRASVPRSALVAFTIAPSGEIERASIVKSSGSSQFDRDALKMVKRAAPFPKPPHGVNREFVVQIEGR